MSFLLQKITADQAAKLIQIGEGQFSDVKAIDIAPAKLTQTISSFANSDGGDLYIGIDDDTRTHSRGWRGFERIESANGHIQIFEQLFPLGSDFQYEFLACDAHLGLLLHVQINKTQDIKKASNGIAYVRRGSQKLPVSDLDGLRRLEYAKGVASFESETKNVLKELITQSDVIREFIREVVPEVEPEKWLKKQQMIRNEMPTVAGLLMFADEPQAVLPKRCGIKVYRYKTSDQEGFREALAFDPKTVEGHIYRQIHDAVRLTTEITESIPKMGASSLESIEYPAEAIHEIITNAVIHRDYSIADDVHIRIFDNRVEVQSPGKLPAHITVKNILDERFARNGAVVRILNKFPDPPNKDVGEGLNTAFSAMHKLGLKEPFIKELENAVLVTIRHEPLASPEEAIMEYLETHESIKNSEARAVTHIPTDYRIKSIFGRMVDTGLIEQVPGTRTSSTAYRKVQKSPPATDTSSEARRDG